MALPVPTGLLDSPANARQVTPESNVMKVKYDDDDDDDGN